MQSGVFEQVNHQTVLDTGPEKDRMQDNQNRFTYINVKGTVRKAACLHLRDKQRKENGRVKKGKN